MKIDTKSINTANTFIEVSWQQPITRFKMPRFGFQRETKDDFIDFYSMDEIRKFLKKLHKSWLIEMVLNKE